MRRTWTWVAAAVLAAGSLAWGDMVVQRWGSAKTVAAPARAAKPSAVPKAFVPVCTQAPAIDGQLDDDAWAELKPLALAKTLDGGGPAAQPTEVRLCRDEKNLYVAFRCVEPNLDKIVANKRPHDGEIYADDSVEFFLGTAGGYYHFGVNAVGSTYDGQGKNKEWQSGFKAAAARGKGEWTVEASVPLDKIAGGKLPDELIANFNRNRQVSGGLQESAWSPTGSSDSHEPDRFGKLLLKAPAAEEAKDDKPAEAVKAGAVEFVPAANGEGVLKFDLSNLPKGAKIVRADLFLARGKIDGSMDEARTDVAAFPLVKPAAAGAEVKPAGKPLAIRGPWFDCLDATEAVAAWASGKENGGFFIQSCPLLAPAGCYIDVAYEGQPQSPPPQASQVKLVHRSGQSFITWKEIEDVIAKDQLTWGELRGEIDDLDRQRQVRYCVYRSNQPITAKTLDKAELIARVAPLSCWNVNGRNIERPIDDYIATKDMLMCGQWNPFGSASVEGDFGRDCPMDRLVIADGQPPLPRGTGLYVHTAAAKGKAYYAVVTSIDGAQNTADLSDKNVASIDEDVAEPAPVLQVELPRMPMFNYPQRRLHYVQWVAPPLTHMPSQYYNWSVGVPNLVTEGKAKPVLEVALHRDGFSYWRTPLRMEVNSIVLTPHDFPIRTWWYGHHESLGTLKSFNQGVVQPYTERRVLAFVKWAGQKWSADMNKLAVTGCRGGAGGAGALRLGLRHPEVFTLVVSGHGEPRMADVAAQTDKKMLPVVAAVTALWGKPDWACKTDKGQNVWDELDMVKLATDCPAKADLPLVALTSGNKGSVPAFHKAMLEGGRALLANFSWGGTRYIPVSATETFPNAVRLDVRRDTCLVAVNSAPAVATTTKGGMGEFNTDVLWSNAVDEPGKLEITVNNTSRGRAAYDLTLRRIQKFQPGKACKWSIQLLDQPEKKDAKAPALAAEGECNVSPDGVVTCKNVIVPGRVKLTVVPQ